MLALYRPPRDEGLFRRFNLPREELVVSVENEEGVLVEARPFYLEFVCCRYSFDFEEGRWHCRSFPKRYLIPLIEK